MLSAQVVAAAAAASAASVGGPNGAQDGRPAASTALPLALARLEQTAAAAKQRRQRAPGGAAPKLPLAPFAMAGALPLGGDLKAAAIAALLAGQVPAPAPSWATNAGALAAMNPGAAAWPPRVSPFGMAPSPLTADPWQRCSAQPTAADWLAALQTGSAPAQVASVPQPNLDAALQFTGLLHRTAPLPLLGVSAKCAGFARAR
jgi:hypothetical protein